MGLKGVKDWKGAELWSGVGMVVDKAVSISSRSRDEEICILLSVG